MKGDITMCVWVGLSNFGVKHIRLLNTSYVRNLIDNNILYVVPMDVHQELMSCDSYNYIMKDIIPDYILTRNIGRVRSVDVNNHAIEIDVNPVYKDYLDNMTNPRISFLANAGLNKTGSIFYIYDAKNNIIEEGEAV